MSTTITALVTNVERVRNTANGNTVQRVTLSVASSGWPGVIELLTKPDSSIGQIIGNAEYRDTPHVFTISREMRIVSAIPAGI